MDLTLPTITAPNFNIPTQLSPSNPLLQFIPSLDTSAPASPVPANLPGQIRNPFLASGANRPDYAIPAPRLTMPTLTAPTIPGIAAPKLNASAINVPPLNMADVPGLRQPLQAQATDPSAGIAQTLGNNSQLLGQNHDLITSNAQARQLAAQQRVDYLTHTGSGVDQIAHPLDANGNPTTQHPGFWRELGSIGAHIGDDVLSIAAPGVAALTPGTTLHHQMLLNQAEGQEGQATNELMGQANLARAGADTANENAATNLLLHPRPKYQPLSTATGIDNYDPATGGATPVMGTNGQSVMPYVKPGPIEPKTIIGPDGKTPIFANYQNGQYLNAQGNPIPNARPYEKPGDVRAVTLNVPGKGRVAGKADAQGNLLLESGQPAPQGSTLYQQPQQPSYASILPMLTAGRAIDAATTKWQQEAGAYQGALNTLAEAKTGSELSASLVPLGIALVTPTAAGVHRINTAEIAQAGSQIGSMGRRLDAALEKAGSGALPPDTIREAEQFVRMYQKLKYRQYVAEAHQAADTFKMPADHAFVTSMDGQQEMPLSSALQQQQAEDAQGGAHPKGATMKVPGSDGKMHWSDGKRDMGVAE